jgi:thiamine-monophosphate kinase
VELVRRRFGGRSRGLVRGIGDDAAVFRTARPGELWVATTDMLVEKVDFRAGWLRPEDLGHKALAVNLSDVAAMGAVPRYALAALALPRSGAASWIARFYRGWTGLARRSGVALIGGDLSRSPGGIQVAVTVLGSSRSGIVYRSGGRPGDLLYVTGTLGCAAAGLHLLRRGRRRAVGGAARRALQAQARPEPRCEVGAWLARSGFARAMIDLSDGLSTDLARLCSASSVGAEVDIERLPLFREASGWGLDPVRLALDGGEDYELLVAVPAARAPRLERAYLRRFPPLTRIGRLVAGRGVSALTGSGPRRLPPRGFDHFFGGR